MDIPEDINSKLLMRFLIKIYLLLFLLLSFGLNAQNYKERQKNSKHKNYLLKRNSADKRLN
ncbi:MAG: hypothetical protein CM15mP109_13180 [Candidatus Dadabacteria bacterium]|nr:MAG: hypothetical protein CM15mP109_13180 [Candidatus Dadabacteria bacterium]